MSKITTKYVCQSCGYNSPRWVGKCPNCGEWNTFVEEASVPMKASRKPAGARSAIEPVPLAEIDHDETPRLQTGMEEFDRVLGGGIVPGSLILLGGDPGIGKSTLLLQTAIELAPSGPVLYVSGEESPSQIKMRAVRLGTAAGVAEKEKAGNSNLALPDNLFIVTETNIESIFQHVEAVKPRVLVIDSIQTAYD